MDGGFGWHWSHWCGLPLHFLGRRRCARCSAGIVGIFILGLFSRRANKQGLYIGIAAAVLYTAYAVLTSTKVDIHGTGIKETLLDLGDWNFTHHKYMLGVYSHLIVLVVGYIASYFFKTPLADKELTIYGYLEDKKKAK